MILRCSLKLLKSYLKYSMYKVLITVIITLIAGLLLKSYKSNISILLSIAVSVGLLVYTSTLIETIISFLNTLAGKVKIDNGYIVTILKCVGICLLGEFTSSLCKDCGETTLALNTEFMCKCTILLLSIPVYGDVFNMILKLMQL